MNQKGFIQIPLLIIIIASIVVASVGTGVVLYKQEKLTPLIANISEVFKGAPKTTTTEEFESEEPQAEQQPRISQEEIVQQELEQTRLEKEKAKAEAEKAKAEAERLRKEAEEAQRLAKELKRQQEAQRLAEEERQREIARQQELERQRQLEEQRKQEEERQGKFVSYSGSEFGGRIHDYFPIITSFFTDPSPTIPINIGDEIHLKVEVHEPKSRQILYSWWCWACGLPVAHDKIWTTNNEIRYTITSEDVKKSGESMRIGVYIKSEKEYYRTGSHGYDDGVYTDYKISF